jgi:protein required for attachment to host cells
MTCELIVVANSNEARFFRRDTGRDPFVPLETLKAGAPPVVQRPHRTSLAPHTDPKRKRHQLFAHALSQHIDALMQREACSRLLMLAACPFLGEVRRSLSPPAQHALRAILDLDLTHFGLDEIESRVRQAVAAYEHPESVAAAQPI